jgi:hypothetical protein
MSADRGIAIDGRLDAVVDGSVLGWAWCPLEPTRRLEIVLMLNDRPVARRIADQERDSLRAAGIGDGAHAFGIALPPAAADGSRHTIRVLAGGQLTPLSPAAGFAVQAAPEGPWSATEFVPGDRPAGRRPSAERVAPPLPPAPARRPPLASASALTSADWSRRLAGARAWLAYRGITRATAPFVLLGTGCGFYFLLFVYLTRQFGFFQDEWEFIINRRGWNANAFLVPHVQSLLAVPILVYKLLFVTVGVQTTWPYRIPGFALHIACVAGLYVLARGRGGDWLALIPAGLLLVLGAGFEDELWGIMVSFLGSVAAGIWALICLDRKDRFGDVAAAVLIGVALASSSMGIPFAVAIAAELALVGRRRLWVVAIPVALYLLWDLDYGQSSLITANLPHVPGYDLQIGAYGFAGLLGLSTYVSGAGGVVEWIGIAMLAAAVLWLVRRLRWDRSLPTRAVTGIVGALALWSATALARYQDHQPYSSQYVYGSAVFILLTAIAFMHWRRVRAPVAAAIAVLGVAIAVVGYLPMHLYMLGRDSVDGRVAVAFGAAQIAGPAGDPAFIPDAHHLKYVTLGDYLRAARALGPLGLSPGAIERTRTSYRQLADTVLIGAERLAPRPAGASPAGTSCTRAQTTGATALVLSVAPGRSITVRAPSGGAGARIWLRRLSAAFPLFPQWTVGAQSDSTLALPRDASTLPWQVQIAGIGAAGAVQVIECPIA